MAKGYRKINRKLCFMSLHISGVRKCKYSGRYKKQSYPYLLTFLNSVGLVLDDLHIYLIIEIKSFLKLHTLKGGRALSPLFSPLGSQKSKVTLHLSRVG